VVWLAGIVVVLGGMFLGLPFLVACLIRFSGSDG
jgi:hypothetical protein